MAACHSPAPRPRAIGLVTSLSIFWPETHSVAALLDSRKEPHWARGLLEARGGLVPLDRIEAGSGSLAGVGLLVLAQPRPLAPEEYLALDRWVREGGHVLLFADPLLTVDSRFGLGDPRRPQDIAMLAPILARWGLDLVFDEDQPAGERMVDWRGTPLPVNLPGRLLATRPRGNCRIEAAGIVAFCNIGRGQALVLADAAMLESGGSDSKRTRAAALTALLDALVADSLRENPGKPG